MHGAQRRVAHTAARHVDDALERQVVGRLHRGTHIGDGVADFLAFVEAQAADHAIGHADQDQPLLKGAGLEAGAHQDGDLGQGVPVAAQRLDALADHAGFFVGVPQPDHGDLFPVLGVGSAGTQCLAEPALVMRDQARGGGEDRGGGAVVGLQPDDLRAGKILLEAQDVFHLGAAPGVDRLIVVSHAADIAMRLCKEPQPQVLDQVGVLVFVHQDVAEHAVVLREDLRLGAQQFGRVQQKVTEVGSVQRAQAILVGGVQRTGAAVGEVDVLGRGDPVRGQAAILPALDRPHQRWGCPTLGVDPLRLHDLLE